MEDQTEARKCTPEGIRIAKPLKNSTQMSILYFALGQAGWFACVLGAARGYPSVGIGLVVLLLTAHCIRADRPVAELQLITATAIVGVIWESLLVATHLLHYSAPAPFEGAAPYWIVALWALFAAQFNTTYTWLKRRPALAALLGALAGPLTFHAGARLGALRFERPWMATLALAGGWACLLPLVAVFSKRWDGIRNR